MVAICAVLKSATGYQQAAGWIFLPHQSAGPPAVLKQALQQVVETKLQHYPDPESKNLQQVLAHHHGLKPENVLCGNGASQLLWLALAVWPKGRLLLPVPSFSEYERNARLWGRAGVSPPEKVSNLILILRNFTDGWPTAAALY